MLQRSTILRAVVALLVLTGAGVAGFMFVAGLSLFDALYMTVITLSTVGYREVGPVTVGGQIFTMLLIVGGLGVFFFSATLIARDIVEGGLQQTLGRRRVQRQIAGLSEHFIVCGYGRMGRSVCRELGAKPVAFVVIDKDAEALRAAQDDGALCVEGDATEESVLERAGIGRARGLVAALSSDSDNVYVVLTGRELNPALVIVARAEDERSERKMRHAGANRVVSPYVISGHRVAHALLRPAVLDVIDLATQSQNFELQIEEVVVSTAPRSPSGMTLAESGIPANPGVILIAIRKSDGSLAFNPHPDVRIEAGDHLVLVGDAANLRDIEERFGTH